MAQEFRCSHTPRLQLWTLPILLVLGEKRQPEAGVSHIQFMDCERVYIACYSAFPSSNSQLVICSLVSLLGFQLQSLTLSPLTPRLQPSGDHGRSPLLCNAKQFNSVSAPLSPATSWPWLTEEHITKVGHLQREFIRKVLAGTDGTLQWGNLRRI